MFKRLVILLLEFGAGLAGNLLAGWIQQDAWSNLFTTTRFLGALVGAGLMLLILAWLDSERALPWNWHWHRFWYLREVLENPELRRWETDFARLELAQGRRKVSGVEVTAEGKREDLVEVLRDLIAGQRGEVRRTLVLGEPGSGKTTGLERLTLELAREGARRLGFGKPMPVLVRLGNFQEGKLLAYVGQAMRHEIGGRSGKVLGKGIEELLGQGRVVLLFDALDEALGERQEVVLAELGNFLESRAYADVPVVITSRTREDPGGRLSGLQVFEIQDLSDEAVKVFIRAYKRSGHSEEEIRERLEGHGLLESRGLGRNPFWLRLIVKRGAFEGNKSQILNKAVDNLLAREWEKPEVERSWRRVLPRDEQLEETKRGLAWLGYRMSVENQVVLNWGRALGELAKWLKAQLGVEELRPQDVLGLGRDAQVLVYRPGPVRFRHRLLQEFMTAWALTAEEGLLTQEFLERCVRDTDWWETLLMLGGVVPDHTALARDVLGDGMDDQRLFLAVGLLRSVDEPDRELERQVTLALVESLRQGATAEHKQAAVELAKIAGDEVIEDLDGLLREEDRTVKEGAVEILGEIKSRRAAEVLVGSLRDETLVDQVTKALVSIGASAVKLLIGALRDEDSNVRRAATEALGEIGKPAVEPLIEALRDENSGVYQEVVEALGRIGKPAVGPLIGALSDKEWLVRQGAVKALAKIGDARAVDPLIEALRVEDSKRREELPQVLAKQMVEAFIGVLRVKDSRVRERLVQILERISEPAAELLIRVLGGEDSNVHRGMAEALGKIGKPAMEHLIKALGDEDVIMRRGAAKALGEIGHVRAVESLIGALWDEDNHVHREAAGALVKIGEPAVGPLIGALRDVDDDMRWIPAEALVKIGEPAVGPLIGALGDQMRLVRQEAAEALVKIGEPAVGSLIQALRDPDAEVHQRAAEALGSIGAPAVEPLIQALSDPDVEVRRRTVGALGDIRDRRAVEPLIQTLRDPNRGVRRTAVGALSKIGALAVEPLVQALGDPDVLVRWGAAAALGEISHPRAVEPLIQAVVAPEVLVRWGAVVALGKIGDARAVEPLIQALGDLDGGVRREVTWALGKIGDPRAVMPLIQAIRDPDEGVRFWAAMALGEIGDPRALPELERVTREDTSKTLWGNVADAAREAAEQIRERREQ